MVRWFGLLPFANICEGTPQVAIPVGEICGWCDEPINVNDNGLYFANPDSAPHHQECFIRMIVGSNAHQLGACSCHPDVSQPCEETSLSRRDEAKLAFLTFLSRRAALREGERPS
jgi:hypothetical protein